MLYPTTLEGEFEKRILYQHICEILACQLLLRQIDSVGFEFKNLNG